MMSLPVPASSLSKGMPESPIFDELSRLAGAAPERGVDGLLAVIEGMFPFAPDSFSTDELSAVLASFYADHAPSPMVLEGEVVSSSEGPVGPGERGMEPGELGLVEVSPHPAPTNRARKTKPAAKKRPAQIKSSPGPSINRSPQHG